VLLIEKFAVTTYAIQDHGDLNVQKIAKVATMTLVCNHFCTFTSSTKKKMKIL
jgi:hypothetical protein